MKSKSVYVPDFISILKYTEYQVIKYGFNLTFYHSSQSDYGVVERGNLIRKNNELQIPILRIYLTAATRV